jgi:sortase A
LPDGKAAVANIGNAGEPALCERSVNAIERESGSACSKPQVLAHREVVVSEALVPDVGNRSADRRSVAPQVDPEDFGVATVDPLQAGNRAQQGGLPGTIGSRHQNDFARRDLEAASGQRREAADQGHDTAKAHGQRTRGGHCGNADLDADRAGIAVYGGVFQTVEWAGRSRRRAISPYPVPMRDTRLILEWVGRTLLIAGILILGFVGYQLWGTGLLETRAQGSLRDQFDARAKAAGAPAPGTAKPGSAAATTTLPAVPVPAEGAVAVINIPKLGLERTVVNGVTAADLRQGPGHYPQTVMPGEIGNAAIAGHRTTYGAPFNQLDELQPGDPIIVRTLNGTYTYKVTQTDVVSPRDTAVLDPSTDTRLTLTTCNPKYSAAQRLIVTATLDVNASPVPRPPAPTSDAKPVATEASLAGSGVPIVGLLLSGLLLILVGGGWWYAFHRRPQWTTWAIGFALFLGPLFLFYYFVERSLPATF